MNLLGVFGCKVLIGLFDIAQIFRVFPKLAIGASRNGSRLNCGLCGTTKWAITFHRVAFADATDDCKPYFLQDIPGIFLLGRQTPDVIEKSGFPPADQDFKGLLLSPC